MSQQKNSLTSVAGDACVFVVSAVVVSPAAGSARRNGSLCPHTGDVIQPNGSCTLAVGVDIGHPNGTSPGTKDRRKAVSL